MKFKYVEILDDPRAEMESTFLPDNRALQDRVPDHDLIDASLAALQDSNTLADFYTVYIRDSKGRIHQISDCATNVRKVLDEAETKHIDFIQSIMNKLSTEEIRLDSERDRHQAILGLTEGQLINLRQRGASESGLRVKIITNSYLYFSYILHRAYKYFQNNNTNIDGNDYEDGQICQHLSLDTPYCLVANDKGLKKAINETIHLLKRINDPQFQTTLRVADLKELVELSDREIC